MVVIGTNFFQSADDIVFGVVTSAKTFQLGENIPHPMRTFKTIIYIVIKEIKEILIIL